MDQLKACELLKEVIQIYQLISDKEKKMATHDNLCNMFIFNHVILDEI